MVQELPIVKWVGFTAYPFLTLEEYTVTKSASEGAFSEPFKAIASATENANSLVSYSGIEEYLPCYEFPALRSNQDPDQENGTDGHLTATTATEDWQTCASFQIELQTRQINNCQEQRLLIHDLNTGAIETWSSLKTEQLQQWIMEQTRETIPPARAEIDSVQILQSLQSGKLTIIGDRSLQSIHANHPFAIDFSVRFSERAMMNGKAEAIGVSLESGCHVQCSARNLSTGVVIELHNGAIDFYGAEGYSAEGCSTKKHSPENSVYLFRLPQLALSETGIYRLSFDFSVLTQPDLFTSYKLAALQVV